MSHLYISMFFFVQVWSQFKERGQKLGTGRGGIASPRAAWCHLTLSKLSRPQQWRQGIGLWSPGISEEKMENWKSGTHIAQGHIQT